MVLLAGAMVAGQTPLVEEHFDYAEGTLINTLIDQNWYVHSGEGDNPVQVTSPGLEFSKYIGSGVGLAVGLNNNGEDVNKRFDPQTEEGAVYAAFLVRASASVAPGEDGANPRPYFFHFYDPENNTAHRARTFIAPGTQAGKMNVGLSFNANAAQAQMGTDLNFDETYLFVAKYSIVAGDTNDYVSLYVFPEGTDFVTEPGEPTLGPISKTTTQTDITPTGIALRQFNEDQRITVDGIVVRREWDFAIDNTSTENFPGNPQMSLYPNPVTSGTVTLSGFDGFEKHVEVFSVTGAKVLDMTTGANEINVGTLSGGLYYVKIKGDSRTYSSKLIIR